ncbi:unnamed protein product [Owenia fusiformis]|uniref:Uncharacterized protein n=1 Tax=Owenia fusiformis TaxID=6347 RepID=A0A8J1Y3F3_OWEFU|nr:unnamed protein product [Owenia fusiformis]
MARRYRKMKHPVLTWAHVGRSILCLLKIIWRYISYIKYLNPRNLSMRRKKSQNPAFDENLGTFPKPSLWELFIEKFQSEQSTKRRLQEWVHNQIPEFHISNFTDAWCDGIALCALIESLYPGACPRHDLLRPHHRVNNCRLALKLLQKHLGITQKIITAEVMASLGGGFEREEQIKALLVIIRRTAHSQGKKTKTPSRNSNTADTNVTTVVKPGTMNQSDVLRAKGSGLKIGTVGKRAKFTILIQQGGLVDLEIEIQGPSGDKCSEKLKSMYPTRRMSQMFGSLKDYHQKSVSRLNSLNQTRNDTDKSILTDSSGNTYLRENSLSSCSPCSSVDGDHSKRIPFDYQCVGDGEFLVSYIPRSPGEHILSIKCQNADIQGSPFKVKVSEYMSVLRSGTQSFENSFDQHDTRTDSFSFPSTDLRSVSYNDQDTNINHTFKSPNKGRENFKKLTKQATVTRRRILKRVITRFGSDDIILQDANSNTEEPGGFSTFDYQTGQSNKTEENRPHPRSRLLSYQGTFEDVALKASSTIMKDVFNSLSTDRSISFNSADETDQQQRLPAIYESKSSDKKTEVQKQKSSVDVNDEVFHTPGTNGNIDSDQTTVRNDHGHKDKATSNDPPSGLIEAVSKVEVKEIQPSTATRPQLKRVYSVELQQRGEQESPTLKFIQSESMSKSCMYISQKAFMQSMSTMNSEDDQFQNQIEGTQNPNTKQKLRLTRSLPVMSNKWGAVDIDDVANADNKGLDDVKLKSDPIKDLGSQMESNEMRVGKWLKRMQSNHSIDLPCPPNTPADTLDTPADTLDTPNPFFTFVEPTKNEHQSDINDKNNDTAENDVKNSHSQVSRQNGHRLTLKRQDMAVLQKVSEESSMESDSRTNPHKLSSLEKDGYVHPIHLSSSDSDTRNNRPRNSSLSSVEDNRPKTPAEVIEKETQVSSHEIKLATGWIMNALHVRPRRKVQNESEIILENNDKSTRKEHIPSILLPSNKPELKKTSHTASGASAGNSKLLPIRQSTVDTIDSGIVDDNLSQRHNGIHTLGVPLEPKKPISSRFLNGHRVVQRKTYRGNITLDPRLIAGSIDVKAPQSSWKKRNRRFVDNKSQSKSSSEGFCAPSKGGFRRKVLFSKRLLYYRRSSSRSRSSSKQSCSVQSKDSVDSRISASWDSSLSIAEADPKQDFKLTAGQKHSRGALLENTKSVRKHNENKDDIMCECTKYVQNRSYYINTLGINVDQELCYCASDSSESDDDKHVGRRSKTLQRQGCSTIDSHGSDSNSYFGISEIERQDLLGELDAFGNISSPKMSRKNSVKDLDEIIDKLYEGTEPLSNKTIKADDSINNDTRLDEFLTLPQQLQANGTNGTYGLDQITIQNKLDVLEKNAINDRLSEFLEDLNSNGRVSEASDDASVYSNTSHTDPQRCEAYGTGIMHGRVANKNNFQVTTTGGGNGSLSVGIQGPRPHTVLETNVTYTGDDLYEVIYEVAQPGHYVIGIKWSDVAIPGSPFLCKVTY